MAKIRRNSGKNSFWFNYGGPALLLLPDGSTPKVWLKIEHDQYDPQQLDCTVSTSEVNLMAALPPGIHECKLLAQAPHEGPITIWGVRGMSISPTEVTLRASGYDLCCSDEEISEGTEIHITIQLNRNNVLQDNRILVPSYDGTISCDSEKQIDEIKWVENGTTTIALINYVYETTSIGHNTARLQIARPVIRRSLTSDGAQSALQIINTTMEDLSDILLLFSLCSREQVGWYEIAIDYMRAPNERMQFPNVKRWRVASAGDSNRRIDPLINQRDLIGEGFKSLLGAFRTSPHKEALKRAISFLVASFEKTFLESSYALCHAAIEAVIYDLIESDATLPRYRKEDWDALSKVIIDSINRFGRERQLDPNLLQLSSKKATELKRIPITDLIIHETSAMGIQVDDLWPPSLGFEKGLREAIQLRNDLLHRAKTSNYSLLFENRIRLQVLAERIILQTLSWPKERIWRWYDQDLKWVNSQR